MNVDLRTNQTIENPPTITPADPANSPQITAELFEDFLRCQTKSYLRLSGLSGSKSDALSWINGYYQGYKAECLAELSSKAQPQVRICHMRTWTEPLDRRFQLFLACSVTAGPYHSTIDAIENESRRVWDASRFIPIRCIPGDRIAKADRLLVGFDALVLSKLNGKLPRWGKLIHGPRKRTTRVKLGKLLGAVTSLVVRLADQLSKESGPPLALNRHCTECEFQGSCREQAIASDDLSLLPNLSLKERKGLHERGIFTIKQLSYTFRPRRRKRASPTDSGKYYHALRAIAIRENKVHIAGSPTLQFTSTPVFLDVEGVPDRDFYYLIGLRIQTAESCLLRPFWADRSEDEEAIWNAFLGALRDLSDPQIIHYGSYEAQFLRRMRQRYSTSKQQASFVDSLLNRCVNLLSIIYARIYFPTYTNGLKDVADYLGYRRFGPVKSGFQALAARLQWERSRDPRLKTALIEYNAHDCEALQLITNYVAGVCRKANESSPDPDFVNANRLGPDGFFKFGKVDFLLPEFEQINQASYWNYQRERISFGSRNKPKGPRSKKIRRKSRRLPVNKIIECRRPTTCPKCKARKIYKYGHMKKILYDLKFGPSGVKRWIIQYLFDRYICWACRSTFIPRKRPWTRGKLGPDLLCYTIYQIIELQIPQGVVARSVNDLFGLHLTRSAVSRLKTTAAQFYSSTYQRIIRGIISGNVVHVDETKIKIAAKDCYVWTLTSQDEVAYFFTETRAGEKVQTLLSTFHGVLVSDFYSVYDSIDCPQQKCLIHMIRDLNDSLSREPFNVELKDLCQTFAAVLKPIIKTVDAYGLKSRYLRKHKPAIGGFFKWLDRLSFQSEAALKLQKRLQKNRNKLFTFLDYNQVPWNNNNAEHAIKSLVTLRRVFGGKSSAKGINEYLVLLSICETCKYMGLNFLNFLRSGSRNVAQYRNEAQKKRGQMQ